MYVKLQWIAVLSNFSLGIHFWRYSRAGTLLGLLRTAVLPIASSASLSSPQPCIKESTLFLPSGLALSSISGLLMGRHILSLPSWAPFKSIVRKKTFLYCPLTFLYVCLCPYTFGWGWSPLITCTPWKECGSNFFLSLSVTQSALTLLFFSWRIVPVLCQWTAFPPHLASSLPWHRANAEPGQAAAIFLLQ